jgi:hypothetical protein
MVLHFFDNDIASLVATEAQVVAAQFEVQGVAKRRNADEPDTTARGHAHLQEAMPQGRLAMDPGNPGLFSDSHVRQCRRSGKIALHASSIPRRPGRRTKETSESCNHWPRIRTCWKLILIENESLLH